MITRLLQRLRGARASQSSLRESRSANGEYPRLHYDDEDSARAAIAVVDDHTMVSYQRLVTLWQQVRYLDTAQIDGCLVECGTWRGGSSALMALAHLHSGAASRRLHMFDSFEGLPQPDARTDGESAVRYAAGNASAALTSIGQCVASIEDVRHLIHDVVGYPTELTQYHVGWFQQTVPADAAQVRAIALLRLDGDWYESTRICLQHLYPLVSSRGIVVIDDYGHWEGCRRAVDEFFGTLTTKPFLNHIDSTGRYVIVP